MRLRTLAGVGVAAAAVVALVVATAFAGAAAPKYKPGIIKVGLITTTDFAAFEDPNLVSADRAAIIALDARGGYAGHKVELDFCNDQANPNQAIICARQMVSDDVAFMAGGATLQGAVIVPILAAAGIPMVGENAISAAEDNTSNMFLLSGGTNFGWDTLGAWAVHEHLPTAIASASNASATPVISAIKATMVSAGGQAISTTLVAPTQADFSPIVASTQQGGAKAVLMLFAQPQTVQYLAAENDAGSPFTTLFTENQVPPQNVASVGGNATIDKLVTAVAYPPLSTSSLPIMKRFRSELNAVVKAGDPNADVTAQTTVSFSGWLAIQAIAQIIKTQHITNVTSAILTRALNNVKNVNLGGAIPPWTPSTPGPAGFTRVSNQNNYLEGWKNGQPYEITPKPVTLTQAIAGQFG